MSEMLETDNLTLDQIRAAADKEAAKTAEEQWRNTAQPADDPDPDPEDPDDPNVTVFRATIDLGDGSGVQVFEADTQEELNEKLVEAQINATRKIRQQEAELKDLRSKTAVKPQPAEISEDDEYVFSQEMAKHPTKAIRAIFKRLTGREIEEFTTVGQRLDAVRDAEEQNQAMTTFLATHEDFDDRNQIDGKPNPNGQLMKMKLAELGLPVTSENLHRAYLDLKKSGLLVLKSEEAHADPAPRAEATERIAQPTPEVTQTRTRRSSGVSSHSRRAAPATQEPSEDEAYKMPLDQLRQLANKQLASR